MSETDEIERSPTCCGCASFPFALCPPCWRWNYDRAEYKYVENLKRQKHDPDHLSPAEGGNKASDDYW